MHVSCPYCTSIFDVRRSDLGASGRQVQCGICEHEWFIDSATHGDAPETEADISVDMFVDDSASPSLAYGSPDALLLDELPAGNMPSLMSFHHSASRRNRYQQSFVAVSWIVLITISFAIVTYATIYRDTLVEKLPALSKIYRVIKLDVDDETNIRAFAITDTKFSVQFRNLERILHVKGTVTNISQEVNTIPTLRVALNNIYGKEEYSTRIKIPIETIGPGETASFEHTIFNFPVNASDLFIVFLKRSEELYSAIRFNNTDIPIFDTTEENSISPTEGGPRE